MKLSKLLLLATLTTGSAGYLDAVTFTNQLDKSTDPNIKSYSITLDISTEEQTYSCDQYNDCDYHYYYKDFNAITIKPGQSFPLDIGKRRVSKITLTSMGPYSWQHSWTIPVSDYAKNFVFGPEVEAGPGSNVSWPKLTTN